jgi:hypothetical protein
MIRSAGSLSTFCRGRVSSVGVATGYGVDRPGIESQWGLIFLAHFHTCHPASYTIPTGSLPGVKRPGRGHIHPLPSSAAVKESKANYVLPAGPSWQVVVWKLPLLACYFILLGWWTVRGSNPSRGEIFRTCPDRPWGPPSLLYNGYRVFPGGKLRPGRAADYICRSAQTIIRPLLQQLSK